MPYFLTALCAVSCLYFNSGHLATGCIPFKHTGSHQQISARWVFGAFWLGVCSSRSGTNWPLQTVLLEEWTRTGKPEHPSLEQRPTEPAPQQQPRGRRAALLPSAKRQPPVSLPNVLGGYLQNTSVPSSAVSLRLMASSISWLGPPLFRLPEVSDAYQWPRQRRGQEPTRNNENHLQSRKPHLLDETLSSNKTCLDNSSFITRLFRC